MLGGPPAARTLEAGESLSFNASDIHRVSHAGTEPAVTLHAYSPPLWRMGAYEILDGGRLRRHSLSYAEELRPLACKSGDLEVVVLRLSGGQVESLFDLGLPVEVAELPADLAALDRLLDDPGVLAPIEAAWAVEAARSWAADGADGPLRAVDGRQGAVGLGL